MIYDAVEQAYAVVSANFATDFAALVAAKGVTGTQPVQTIVKRQTAELYVSLNAVLPAIGVYGLEARTQAKLQTVRDNECVLVFDYYAEGTDPVAVAKQVELAAEALLMSVDRISSAASGLFGAGELLGAVRVVLTEGFVEATQGTYARRAQVTFTAQDRDTGL